MTSPGGTGATGGASGASGGTGATGATGSPGDQVSPLLYPYAAPDGVELLVTWLMALPGDVGPQRYAGQGLPYRWVSDSGGAVDDKVTEQSTFSIHTFAADYWDARTQARLTHRRMLALGPPLAGQQRVALASGRTVFVDGVDTAEPPTWQDYGDNTIHRFVARYTIDLRFALV